MTMTNQEVIGILNTLIDQGGATLTDLKVLRGYLQEETGDSARVKNA